MPLKDFFFEPDPLTLYKREVIAAVKNGEAEKLRELLQKDIDAPPSMLNDALEKAVAKDMRKITEMLLKAPGTRTLDSGTLRQIVYDDRKDMFRLLTDHGFNFANCVPGEGASTYMGKLNYMQKDYECDQLRGEVAALKKELTELKTGRNNPVAVPAAAEEEPLAKEPKKFDL